MPLLLMVFRAGLEADYEDMVSSEVESATMAYPSERTRSRLDSSETEPPLSGESSLRN